MQYAGNFRENATAAFQRVPLEHGGPALRGTQRRLHSIFAADSLHRGGKKRKPRALRKPRSLLSGGGFLVRLETHSLL